MSLESATFISQLDATNPTAGDQVKQGDDHLRLVKSVLQACFPNADKAFYLPDSVTKTANYTIVAADINKRFVVDATGGAFNLTLPTLAASDDGWAIWVVKSDATANAITIVGTVSDAVNPTIREQYQGQFIFWSGTAWWTVGGRANPSIVTLKDAGATVGPTFFLLRDSASPAAFDNLGSIDFLGRDSATNQQLYARILGELDDPTSTSEDGSILLQATVAGVLTTLLQTTTTGITTPTAALTAVGAPLSIPGSTTANRPGSPVEGNVRYNTTLHALEWYNGTVWISQGQQPAIQRLLSGTAATFTPTTGAVRWRIRMWGAGGGGGAQATNTGSTGGTTSFKVNADATAWTAIGGTGGLAGGGGSGGAGGVGGTGGTDGTTGTKVLRLPGNVGGGNTGAVASAPSIGGPAAMVGLFGGSVGQLSAGQAAPVNSGGGGSGAFAGAGASALGGGGGEYVEFWVTGMTTGTYTVGAAGAGGVAGTRAGGDGGSGCITVEEYFA